MIRNGRNERAHVTIVGFGKGDKVTIIAGMNTIGSACLALADGDFPDKQAIDTKDVKIAMVFENVTEIKKLITELELLELEFEEYLFEHKNKK